MIIKSCDKKVLVFEDSYYIYNRHYDQVTAFHYSSLLLYKVRIN